MSILEVDSVQLSFDRRRGLSDVYLRCETGDIVGILGRNGSGKSSLLKIIFGTLQAEYQSVRINGIYARRLYTLSKAVCIVPQDGLFMDYLTFNDLVRIFELEASLDVLLEVDEVRLNRAKQIGTLSGGIRKVMEILTFLYSDSNFVFIDIRLNINSY